MSRQFNVEVHSNGLVVTPLGLGEAQFSKVFGIKDIEEALLEMYHLCYPDWKVGDKVKIISEVAPR